MIAGNTGNVVCNTSFTNLSDSRVKTEMARPTWQSSNSVRLRGGQALDDFAGTKWKNMTDRKVERRHGKAVHKDPRTGFGSIHAAAGSGARQRSHKQLVPLEP